MHCKFLVCDNYNVKLSFNITETEMEDIFEKFRHIFNIDEEGAEIKVPQVEWNEEIWSYEDTLSKFILFCKL